MLTNHFHSTLKRFHSKFQFHKSFVTSSLRRGVFKSQRIITPLAVSSPSHNLLHTHTVSTRLHSVYTQSQHNHTQCTQIMLTTHFHSTLKRFHSKFHQSHIVSLSGGGVFKSRRIANRRRYVASISKSKSSSCKKTHFSLCGGLGSSIRSEHSNTSLITDFEMLPDASSQVEVAGWYVLFSLRFQNLE